MSFPACLLLCLAIIFASMVVNSNGQRRNCLPYHLCPEDFPLRDSLCCKTDEPRAPVPVDSNSISSDESYEDEEANKLPDLEAESASGEGLPDLPKSESFSQSYCFYTDGYTCPKNYVINKNKLCCPVR